MRLHRLTLEHFRNHEDRDYRFENKHENLAFIGENSVGKSNLLEAITMLSVGKSFRTRHTKDLIQWGKPFARIRADIERSDGVIILEIFLQRDPSQKLFFVNKKRVKAQDFIGQCPMVTFIPEDLDLIRGERRLRRRYLNVVLAQVSRKYREALFDYEKALAERNALLKAIREKRSNVSELVFWDAELIRSGVILTKERQKYVEEFNRTGKTLTLQYQSLFDLDKVRDRDIALGTTTVGPHRDSLFILLDNRAIETTASRSQERDALLTLKFFEAAFIEKHIQQKPILVLDDILSEFDSDHRARILAFLQNRNVIMTVLPDTLPRETTFTPFHFERKRA